MKRTTPLKRTGFKPKVSAKPGILRTATLPDLKKVKKVSYLRMTRKELAVTTAERLLWNRMATEIGCIACYLDGIHNTYVSIHHIDGRTKPGCHSKVLPLCAPHHQRDDTDPMKRDAVHPNKARFEAKYGSQYELLALAMSMLGVKHG